MTLALIESGLSEVKNTPQDYEDTLFMALTRRDVLFIGAALPFLVVNYSDFDEDSIDLQVRLGDAIEVQKPEWVVNPDWRRDGEEGQG